MNCYNVLNRFFSQSIFTKLINADCPNCYGEIIKRYTIDENLSNRQIISTIYKVLNDGYRNEYFYKNTLLNKLIVKKHAIYTTKVLMEFPIGKSIADFITLNGKAIVYEIKTELDNLDRLNTQISDYYKCFPFVCIVTCEEHLKKVLNLIQDTHVGLYVITKKNSLKTLKEPTENLSLLNLNTMFKVLRKKEFENILMASFNQLPQTNQFEYYKACNELFNNLSPINAYYAILNELKKRCKIEVDRFNNVPMELKLLVYQSNLKNQDYSKLEKFLDSTFIGG